MYGYEHRDSAFAPKVAWKKLRTMRSTPPGPAVQPERKALFDAALEQAEQLFAAAASVTPATSPLLLFYGLSQAGRAVAAANTADEEWTLMGHGLKNGSLADVTADGLAHLTVWKDRRGAFVQLAHILDAAPLSQPVFLGDLWCLIPGAQRFPLPGMGSAVPLMVTTRDPMMVRNSSYVRAYVAPFPVNPSHISRGAGGGWEQVRREVEVYLSHYPSLAGWRLFTPEGQPIDATFVGEGLMRIALEWEAGDGTTEQAEIAKRTVPYGSDRLAFPGVGTDDRPAHPFLIWWALLFILSKLARYEPEAWAALISVDKSNAAVAIEHLLAHGLTVLPEIIYRTLLEVSKDR
jgi:hypothetical protein